MTLSNYKALKHPASFIKDINTMNKRIKIVYLNCNIIFDISKIHKNIIVIREKVLKFPKKQKKIINIFASIIDTSILHFYGS